MQDNLNDIVSVQALTDQVAQAEVLLEKLAKKYRDVIEDIKKNPVNILGANSSKSSDSAIKDAQDNIQKTTKAAKDYNTAITDTEKLQRKLDLALTDQAKVEAELRVKITARNKELRTSAQTALMLGSETEKFNIKLRDATKAYTDLAYAKGLDHKLTVQALADLKALRDTQVAVNTAYGNHSQNVGNYKSALEGLSGITSDLVGSGGKLGDIFRTTNNVMNVFFTSFRNNRTEINNFASATSQGGDAVEGFGGKLKALMKIPIVLLITAIVAALYGLFKAFTSTDSGATLFAARMEQVSAIIDVVRQRAALLAQGIVKIFDGDWKGASEDFSNSFKDASEQIKQATQAAWDYIYAIDALEDAEIGYISERAKNANKIAKLEFDAADRTKSLDQRRKSLKEAISISATETAKEEEFAKKRYETELEYAAKKNGINAFYLKKFIESNDTEQEKLLAQDFRLRKVRDNMNDDGQKKLEELYAKRIDANTKFFEENKRNNSKLTGFEEQERKKAEEAAKKALENNKKRQEELKKQSEKTAQVIMDQMNNIVSNENSVLEVEEGKLLDQLKRNEITTEQYGKKKELLTKETEDRILKLQIDALNDYLTAQGLLPDEIAKIQERITDLVNQERRKRASADEAQVLLDKKLESDKAKNLMGFQDAMYKDAAKKKDETDKAKIELEKRTQRQIRALAQETAQFLTTLIEGRLQKEIDTAEKLQEVKQAEFDKERETIEASGEDEKKKTELLVDLDAREKQSKEELDKQISAARLKQAKFDRAATLASIAFNTAAAVAAVLSTGGGTRYADFGISAATLSALVIATGAVQAATVLATPLPEYEHGKKTTDSYEGFGIISEHGQKEIMIDKHGVIKEFNQPSLIYTQKGDRIISNDELKQMERGQMTDDISRSDNAELIRMYAALHEREKKNNANDTDRIIAAVRESKQDNSFNSKMAHARA